MVNLSFGMVHVPKSMRRGFWISIMENLNTDFQGLTRMVDGFPIEIHHDGRTMDSTWKEMTRTDHRLGDNYKKTFRHW